VHDDLREALQAFVERLVAEHDAGFRGRAALVHVQVRTADGRRGELDDDVARMLAIRGSGTSSTATLNGPV